MGRGYMIEADLNSLTILEKIKYYYVNPRLLEIPNIENPLSYFQELTLFYNKFEVMNLANDYGITLCLVKGVEFDNRIWFDEKKPIEFFNRICEKYLSCLKLNYGGEDRGSYKLRDVLRLIFKALSLSVNNDLHFKETKLSYKQTVEYIRDYVIHKKEYMVKVVNNHIEEVFEYLKHWHPTVYETLFSEIFPSIYTESRYIYPVYEKRGKEYLDWLRVELAQDYSKLFGNHEYPINDILNDPQAIRAIPIIYSPQYGLVYVFTNYKWGVEHTKYWEMSQQDAEIMNLQIKYFVDNILKQSVSSMFLLINVPNLGFRFEVRKLDNIKIDKNYYLLIKERFSNER